MCGVGQCVACRKNMPCKITLGAGIRTVPVIVPERRDLLLRVEPVHVEHDQDAVVGGLVDEGVEAVEVVEALDGGVHGLVVLSG